MPLSFIPVRYKIGFQACRLDVLTAIAEVIDDAELGIETAPPMSEYDSGLTYLVVDFFEDVEEDQIAHVMTQAEQILARAGVRCFVETENRE